LEKLASNLDGFKGTATQEIVTIRYFGNPVNFQMILKLALMPLRGEGWGGGGKNNLYYPIVINGFAPFPLAPSPRGEGE